MNIAIYVRVSTDKQTEGNSIDDQISQISSWAEDKKNNIVKVYKELGASAYGDNRPVFRAMIEDALSIEHPYDAIVIHSLSRFYRDNVKRELYRRELNKASVQVLSLTQPLPDDENMAYLSENMIGIIDEFSSRETSKHVSRCRNENAKKGFFNGSMPPYGYKSVDTDVRSCTGYRKKLVINPKEAEVVRTIFKLSLNGLSGIPYGTKRIATYLNQAGILRRGKKWRFQAVHTVLRNRTYIGDYITNKINSKTKTPRPVSEHIITAVPPIIEVALFEKVGMGLASRNIDKTESKSALSSSLLTGLLKCSTCKCGMNVMTAKSGGYKYYRCADKTCSDVNICSCPNVRKDHLEEAVVTKILEVILAPARIQSTINVLKKIISQTNESDAKQLLKLQRERSRINEKITNIYEQVAEGDLVIEETLKEFIQSQQSRHLFLTNQINGFEKRRLLSIKKIGDKQVKDFANAIKDAFSSENSEVLKGYLYSIVDEIRVSPTKVKVVGNDFSLVSAVSRWKPSTPLTRVPRDVSSWYSQGESNPCFRRERPAS